MSSLTGIYLTIIGVYSALGVAVPTPLEPVVVSPSAGSSGVENGIRNKEQNFKDFSHNLLLHSDLDEFSIEKGAAISSPFGVGYMLANINEKVWNVSNEGVGGVLQTDKVADDYQGLVEKMLKSQMSISSTLFTRDGNVSTSTIPEGSRRMKTETKVVDFIDDWKTTWATMNERISNQTDGILDDQLIPKGKIGGWWGGAFYYFTMGAYVNTNHYKGSWNTSWVDIGQKKFYDGLTVPYIEAEGTFPYVENENYTAVGIKLKDGKKSVVFVLPKIPLVPFLKTDMPKLVQTGSPQSWNSVQAKNIQIPSLKITLLDQHFKKLEALGVNYTFCVDEPESLEVAMKKGPYFMSPLVQAHHVQIDRGFFQVASATGSSLNSEQKMREEGVYTGPTGPADEEEQGQGEGERSEFVLPMDMDPQLIKALVEGEVQLKKVDVVVADDGKNDTISAAASSVEQISVLPDTMQQNQTVEIPSTENSTIQAQTNESNAQFMGLPDLEKIQTDLLVTTPIAPTTPFVPEPLPPNTVRFDRPFFWYLYDEEMGPLYYGTVHSLATYQKEYGIETDEDLWLYDAYKTLLWNCP